MLKNLYIGTSALFLVGYATWSVMGWETGSKKRDRVPSTSSARSGRSSRSRGGGIFYGRSRRSYYGSSSGWGK